MADLTARERQKLPKRDFALPGRGSGPQGKGAGAYPIDTKARARSALSRVSQFGSPAEKAKVRSAVERKFPSIDKGEKGKRR